jgi:L-seryl-tRNA(Ser) seleniumtransferase
MADNLLRGLPSVDRLLGHGETDRLIDQYGRGLTVEALRAALDETRAHLRAGMSAPPDENTLIAEAESTLEDWLRPTLRRAINATGVIVHTNLGRAPLSAAALDAMRQVAAGYSTLEYDLEAGGRGSRSVHAESLLHRLTGAEAALVVNNNAAAVLLTLSALAGPTRDHPAGRGAIISRGQLVEIGGGFRMPDVMAQSGARMAEVGATNRTHLRDYEAAIDGETALIVRAHRSNFALVGFTGEPTLAELVALARRHSLMVVDDLGSGALLDTSAYGLAPEPTVGESLAAGADVALFSGDKLLGGPQAGIIVGRKAALDPIRRHPLARAVRPDKLALSALAATLTHYLKGEALTHIPVWQMIGAPLDALQRRAEGWRDQLAQAGLTCAVIEGRSTVGGGSLPGESLPTALLAVDVPSPDEATARLRTCVPPVIGRIEDDRLVFDPRTVLPDDEVALLAALRSLVG